MLAKLMPCREMVVRFSSQCNPLSH